MTRDDHRTEVAGWGRYPVVRTVERVSEDLVAATEGSVLSRGLGRSYGDSSLPPDGIGPVTCTRLADRCLSFDAELGVLRAEAGFSLARFNELFLERGWSSPVLPGTQFVTLGGMVASDVHGKNHHVAGCFGEHVRALKLRVANGEVLEVTEDSHPDLFRATIGGMGLTGHILEVECVMQRIPSPWIVQETESVEDLDALVGRLGEASGKWPFTVCWVDCLSRGAAMGRGILIKGRWAEKDEVPLGELPRARRFVVPVDMPSWLLNRHAVKTFNALYHWRGRNRSGRVVVPPGPFFHPLDAIEAWNRLYGRRGFTQYQCVLPRSENSSAARRLFEEVTRSGGASFLSVVKDCGAAGKGMLSFPMSGVSVALDIGLRGKETRELVSRLNEVVIDAGGRIYLTKDALTRPEHFRAMESRLDDWNVVRRNWDPDRRLVSAQSVRLLGDDG